MWLIIIIDLWTYVVDSWAEEVRVVDYILGLLGAVGLLHDLVEGELRRVGELLVLMIVGLQGHSVVGVEVASARVALEVEHDLGAEEKKKFGSKLIYFAHFW